MNVRLDTSLGPIVIALEPQRAPKTVANFLQYVDDGFYDGTLFHRVIDGFVVQGGGLASGLRPKRTRGPIPNEADNGLRNEIGTVTMARTSDPHSASAQFFINLADNDFLDHVAPVPDAWGYCVFGRVIEGMEVVAAIGAVPTTTRNGMPDVPIDEVLIERAELLVDG